MQPRVLHLLRQLNLEPGNVPASNVIFVRSAREKDINNQFRQLAELCWPFHQTVIETLGVRVVLCFGQKSGDWVCKQLNANIKVDQFVEQYEKRHWTSISYKNSDGVAVVVATHPSIADWTTPSADPSLLVKRMLEVTT
jgi:uracil-DNA glycosylase